MDIFEKFRDVLGGRKAPEPAGPVEWLVVGLGNPGREYENTRHNAGFLAVDRLAEKLGAEIKKLKFKALCGDAVIGGKHVVLLKPSTYMNNSGEAVRDAMQFYKIPAQGVVVLSDDISLEVGRLRIRRSGSDGGQKGLRSIIYLTGKDDFPRVRIGIGKKPHPEMALADWVLSRFTDEERKGLDPVLDQAGEAVRLIVEGKTDEAMNRFNQRDAGPTPPKNP